MDERKRLVDDFLRNVRRVWCIDQVQVQPASSLPEEVLWMILRCPSYCVSQQLSVVGFLAGMYDGPTGLPLDLMLVVALTANEKVRDDLNHGNLSITSRRRSYVRSYSWNDQRGERFTHERIAVVPALLKSKQPMGNWVSLPPSETAFRTKLWRTIQPRIWQYFQHIQHFAAGQSNPRTTASRRPLQERSSTLSPAALTRPRSPETSMTRQPRVRDESGTSSRQGK